MHRVHLPRRILFLILVCALLLPLASCALQAQSSGPLTLRIAYRPAVANLEPLLDAYMRDHPGIIIETLELTGSNFPTLADGLEDGSVDVVREFRGTLYSRVRDGAFEALDAFVETGDWGEIKSDYFNGSWEALQVDGRQFAIPAGLDMYVAYANLTAFENANVDPPEEAWTLDDLLMKASAVNQPEGTPGDDQVVYGFGTYYMSADPFIFTYLHGGSLVDSFDNPSAIYLDDQRTVEAVVYYTDLIRKYKVALKPALVSAYFRQGGIATAQAQGYCALWFGMYSGRGGGANTFGIPDRWEFKWKMLPLPQDQQVISLGDADGYYVSAMSQHQQEAVKLIRYLSDQWQASGTRFPARRSLAANERYQEQVGAEIARVGALAAENLMIMPQFYGRSGGGRALRDFFTAIFQILDKGDDPQMALEQAQDKAELRLLQPIDEDEEEEAAEGE